MPQSNNANQREKIRIQTRHKRNHLDENFQHQAAEQLVQQASKLSEVIQANSIAIYLANDGELDTKPLINWCWQQGKHVLLPVLHPFTKGHLIFLQYKPDTLMHNNKYSIAEPKLDVTQVVPFKNVELIFTPLVAFDDKGQRLGMGGGFYDRTLAQATNTKKPYTIGLAHDCQQVDNVPIEPWDIPIPKIITPTRIIKAE
ncbi:5-formyltetrahydrofolate cyclo-ligase [Thalassotalea sp. M1531]|uniref:5-formyltetrahydrofolate cyclo-ligase n=1 Tax=Thalassotalea algicola TaxID=2716224 RepID=A0A7Y0Q818_9GAMM|nr:5-formyltetrahydrofolate cyclo-ligase [Thalassotalea algicola]NMP32973.1 5-formyltetrahydrofolate cyclo-ligase [Thalassotalea algicola]